MREIFDLRDVLEGFSVPAAILASGHRIVAANKRFQDRFAGGDDPCGRTCHELLHRLPRPCLEEGLECPLVRCLAHGGPGRAVHNHPSRAGDEPVELTVCEVTRGSEGTAYFLHLTRSIPDQWLPDELQNLLS